MADDCRNKKGGFMTFPLYTGLFAKAKLEAGLGF
jgi:hypothetical protein